MILTGSGTNTIVNLNLAAPIDGSFSNCISGIYCSYSASPTGGRLQILEEGTVVFDLDLVGTGVVELGFAPAIRLSRGAGGIIRLSAGGAGIVGKVNAIVFSLS